MVKAKICWMLLKYKRLQGELRMTERAGSDPCTERCTTKAFAISSHGKPFRQIN